MNDAMVCTTCKRLVYVNETGTCLACQRGFVKGAQEDTYRMPPCSDYYSKEDLEKYKKLEERKDAIEKRLREKSG